MEITKEKFIAYEKVRQSGLTNMFDVNKVIDLAILICGVELEKEEVLDIMKNYTKYFEKYINN